MHSTILPGFILDGADFDCAIELSQLKTIQYIVFMMSGTQAILFTSTINKNL